MRLLSGDDETDYVDLDSVKREVAFARRICSQQRWPVIDVSRRSIEETAATIIQMLREHQTGGRVHDHA